MPGVVFFLPSLTKLGGGVEENGRQLVEAIAQLRPEDPFTAVLGRERQLARPQLLTAGLRRRLTVLGADGARVERFARLLAHSVSARRHHPDLVICGHRNYVTLARGLALVCGARLVTVLHGIEAWSIQSPFAVAALRASDAIVAVSAFTAAQAARTLGLAIERLTVIPNGIDDARFTPGPPAASVSEKLRHLPRPRLLTVARLDSREAYKGVDIVIQALVQLRERGLSYLVVGEGTDRPRLRALADQLGVPVEFYGYAPDEELVDLYRACDVFVMPSRGEGFGYVFLEAMACGLPTVGGNADGSVEALGSGQLGLLVNPLDPSAVAEGISAHLTGRSPSWMRVPEALHASVAERFGTAAFQRRIEAMLNRLPSPLHGVGS